MDWLDTSLPPDVFGTDLLWAVGAFMTVAEVLCDKRRPENSDDDPGWRLEKRCPGLEIREAQDDVTLVVHGSAGSKNMQS